MANFKVQEISDVMRLNRLMTYSILGLFCVLLMPLPVLAQNFKFQHLIPEKGTHKIIQGQEIGVCQVYHQNLNKLSSYPRRYPHRIHPDLTNTLIHPGREEWYLLDATQYELLYLRFYNFFHLQYQYFFDSLEEVNIELYPALDKNHSKKYMFNIWHDINLYVLDLDIDNDGELETLLGSSPKSRKTISAGTFIVVDLAQQIIDEPASGYLLLPRMLLWSEYSKRMVSMYRKTETEEEQIPYKKHKIPKETSYRKWLYFADKKRLVLRLKQKGYSDKQITEVLDKSIFTRAIGIQDDFFTYQNKTYITRIETRGATRNLFRIYKTENNQTEEICVFKYIKPNSQN